MYTRFVLSQYSPIYHIKIDLGLNDETVFIAGKKPRAIFGPFQRRYLSLMKIGYGVTEIVSTPLQIRM